MTSPLQLRRADSDRRKYVGSTDIRYIAAGEVEQLWRIKRGVIQEPNLDHVFKVQLGKWTESFHADWHCKTTHTTAEQIHGQRLPAANRKLPAFVAASFDYWLNEPAEVLELKHTNERNTHRACATYYMAQIQWQMLVTDEKQTRFSMIPGNGDPIWGHVEADLVMQELLLEKAEAFWDSVQKGIPLGDTGPDAAIAAAAKAVKIDGKRAYDWSRDNQWVALEEKFVLGRAMQKQGKAWEEELKALVPADASEVTGSLVSCKRDKRGALRFDIADTVGEEAERRCETFTLRDPLVADIVRG